MQQFRRGEQAYIPPSLQTEVLNALFDDVLVPEPSESVGWVDEMLVVHEGEKEKEVVGKEKKGKSKKEKRGKEKSVTSSSRSFSCSPSVMSVIIRWTMGSSSSAVSRAPEGSGVEQTVCSSEHSCLRWKS